jgi:hypothetical protein
MSCAIGKSGARHSGGADSSWRLSAIDSVAQPLRDSYYSIGFTWATSFQSKARLHRPGQRRTRNSFFLAAANTVDEQFPAGARSAQELIEFRFGADHRTAGNGQVRIDRSGMDSAVSIGMGVAAMELTPWTGKERNVQTTEVTIRGVNPCIMHNAGRPRAGPDR